MNRLALHTYIQKYLEATETDFVANIPIFVQLAEEEIIRQVQIPDLRKNSQTNFAPTSPYLTTPDDFLSVYSMSTIVGSERYFMTSKEVNFLQETYPSQSDYGVPRFFAIFDSDTFLVAPTPDTAYGVELHYFYNPPSIHSLGDSGRTWLSDNAENALLFGSILQAYIFLKGDQDVVNLYKEKFDKSVADLKILTEGRNRKDSYRNIDRRIPV